MKFIGRAYVLINPSGEVVRCSLDLSTATNYLIPSMHTDFWNNLFGKATSTRVKVFRKHGWSVKKVKLTY